MTLGSLFDGSGGFPLAGALNGIEPKWLAEIEPYPCRVTAARFPGAPNLGDVTKINGAEVEPVDIITFGSPCQDLSVAGKRKGIHEGERSSLFFEAIRIIREMRKRDEEDGRTGVHVRPRFAVWENVHGAFSSNGREDFRAVLEAFGNVRGGSNISVPRPADGLWTGAGCVVGDGWSIAWRVYDAQYWGVPQRRKRIYLVADFGSERAGEILFEREGVCGNPAAGGAAREGTAADAEGGAGGIGGGCVVYALQGNGVDRDIGQNGGGWREGQMYTLNTVDRPAVCFPDKARTLVARGDSSPCVDRGINIICVANSSGGGKAATLDASYYKGPGARNGNEREFLVQKSNPPRKYIVRRLTPLECCRLQGFPDWWEDGVKGSDSERYKMWGNGIALPCAADVLGRVAKAARETED